MIKWVLIALTVILFTSTNSPGADDEGLCTLTRDGIYRCLVEGEAELGLDRTGAQAIAMAMNNAKVRALEEAVGMRTMSKTFIYNEELVSDLVVSTTKGEIVGEKELSRDWPYTSGPTPRCIVRMELMIRPVDLDRRGDFRIDEALVTSPGSVGRSSFRVDEEVQFKVKVNTDAYISIFGVSENGDLYQIYPNRYFKQRLTGAGTEFVYPDDRLRSRGISIRAEKPEGVGIARESVIIIATREKIPEMTALADGKDSTPADLMKELTALDISTWVHKVVGYEIVD